MSYTEFLEGKHKRHGWHGVDVRARRAHLFPFQAAITDWAIKKGRAAIFADTGLGKTRMQIEYIAALNKPSLIIAPLAVAFQTVEEAHRIGVDLAYKKEHDPSRLFTITNYDRIVAFDFSKFDAIVLDESSILKSFMGKTKRKLMEYTRNTPYRLACTATPAPNDHMEIGNHADFLGIMPSNEMLSRWFINDTMNAGNYRLKGHAEEDFWQWVSSWAVCCAKPSDVGHYDDTAYDLPPLIEKRHVITVPGRAEALGKLFLDGNLSAIEIWKDKETTAESRCKVVAEIVSKTDGPVTVWCDTNQESKLLGKLIPDGVEVRGNMSVEEKESRIIAFANGGIRVIITKTEIAGFGLNWQHCHTVIFVGQTYSYERMYQAVRRSYRFGQAREVTVHIVAVDSEQGITDSLARKAAAHKLMMEEMVKATQQHGIGAESDSSLVCNSPIERATGEGWTLYNGDCVQVMKQIDDGAVDLSVFSPPFSNLYIYSDRLEDMGNSKDHEEFFYHFDFAIRELLRITKPGRLAAVHCKDLPLYMGRDGAAGLYDFPGRTVKSFEAAGWTFHSRVTIWKDPVTEMQRTKNHGLLHKNFAIRGEVCRQGMADYVLVFRKWTNEMEDQQIQHKPTPGEFIGENAPEKWNDQRDYSIQVWQRYASPVWDDIRQTRVLQYRNSGSTEDERHICPLQLDVIERCIYLWSNPGDTVFSPFAGIGSEGYESVRRGRKFVGIELKPEYWKVACKNLENANVQLSLL